MTKRQKGEERMKLNPEPYNEMARTTLRNARWAQHELMFKIGGAMNSLFNEEVN